MIWIQYKMDGQIVAAGESESLALGDNVVTIEGVSTDPRNLTERYWFDGIDLLPKQHFTVDAIPIPAVAIIEGVRYELTEQPTFEFSEPGQYIVKVDAGPAFYIEEFTL